MMDPIQQFKDAMRADGLTPPEMIEPGKLYRFPGIDKGRGDDAGRCKLFDDMECGWYMDYSTGLEGTWHAKRDKPFTPAEREAFKRRCEAARMEREAEERQRHEAAATQADEILAKASGDPSSHPYAAKKGVPLGPLVKRGAWPQRGWADALLVPIYGSDGRVVSLEAISPTGEKDYLKGGRKSGGFHPFGKIRGAGRVLIGEGLATVAAVHAVDGSPAVAAMDAGNLAHVARTVRELAPDAELIFLADDDRKPDGSNPGLKAAREAAALVGGLVAVPELDGRKCDFWDVWHERGADAVREALAKAERPETGRTSDPPSDSSDDGEWPEPQPLPEGLPSVAAFDYALLPDTLQPWARDICERVQCAPDYVGAAIMAALGSVIGRKMGIRPQARTDWTVTPNQWALVIGRPGVLKSPAMEAALSPLKRLAAQATEVHKMEMEDYRRAARMAKLKAEEGEKAARKALAKDASADVSAYLDAEEAEAPALRRYIANDTTAAALGELHRQNHNGLLVFRDELVSLLKSLDREDNAEARGFYLTGWNGDSPYTFDRITRGMNLHIPAVCLSLLGSTQPGRIAEYIRQAVRGGSGDDGLIQRFGLLVWPDNGGEWCDVDRWPDGDAKREANRVFEYLYRLEPANIGAQQDTDHNGETDGLPYLRFDPGALGLFLEWRTDLEARLRGGELHPAMESHLAKYRKLVPGLALILHLASGGAGPVSERATLQALAWAEYLESHARRAYASVVTPEISAAKAIIQRLRKGDLPRTFSSRDVWRPGWAMLSDREQVADALRLLVDLDWLCCKQQETGGRTATVYQANPRGLKS